MKKITNPKLVKRNRTIGSSLNLIGLGASLTSAFFAFTNQSTDFVLLYGLLLVAFILFLVGNYFTNRYGRTPAPDDALDNLLKGLDDNFTFIHFRLGHDHALFSPSGILAVLPNYGHGTVEYTDQKKWRQTGVSKLRQLLGAETVGNLALDSDDAAEFLGQSLKKILKLDANPIVRPVVVFVNENTKVVAGDSPIPVLPAAKFKEFVRKLEKQPTITPDQMRVVIEFCGEKP
jgi:hypothetical protein